MGNINSTMDGSSNLGFGSTSRGNSSSRSSLNSSSRSFLLQSTPVINWYEVKLVFMARYLYQKYMRDKILRYRGGKVHHDSSNKSPNWQRGNRRLTEETGEI